MDRLNIDRWIHSSVAQHFKTLVPTVLMYLDGSLDKKPTVKEWFELRIGGPFMKNQPSGMCKCTVYVNTLVGVVPAAGDNVYAINTVLGKVYSAFTSIRIYKYGTTAVIDDQSLIGCMNPDDTITIQNNGTVTNPCTYVQGMIEGVYQIDLTR